MLLIIIILKQCKFFYNLKLTIVLLLVLTEIPSPANPDGRAIILKYYNNVTILRHKHPTIDMKGFTRNIAGT